MIHATTELARRKLLDDAVRDGEAQVVQAFNKRTRTILPEKTYLLTNKVRCKIHQLKKNLEESTRDEHSR